MQTSESEIRQMQARMAQTEQNQKKLMTFLTQAMSNPTYLQQFLNSHSGTHRITDNGAPTTVHLPC